MSETPYVYVERRRGHGCLWGCLGVLALVLAPLLFAWGYSAWHLYSNFRDSPMMRTVIATTERNGLAQHVLGAPIVVTGLEGNAFSYAPGMGLRDQYVLRLQGSRATGTLDVRGRSEGGKPVVESMILTGPDGRRYDLLKDAPLPGTLPDDTI